MDEIYELTGKNLELFLWQLGAPTDPAETDVRIVRIAVDAGELKLKVNEGVWTYGLATQR